MSPRRGLKCLSTATAFVLLSGLFGLFFVFRTPLLWGFDETSQMARAYQVSQGHVFAQYLGDNRTDMGYGGRIPANLLSLVLYVDQDVAASAAPHVREPKRYSALARVGLASPGLPYAFTNTAEYPPIAYIPSATAIRVAEATGLDLGDTIYLARLADLAFYLACMGCALHVLRKTKFRWVVFVVGLLPVSIFQASTVTADTVTNSVAFLLSALVIKAFFVEERLSGADEVLLFLAAATIPVLKPAYLLLDVLVLLIPAKTFTSRRSALAVRAGALGVGLAGFALWQGATSSVMADLSLMRPGPGWQLVSPRHQLHYILVHPLGVIVTLLRSLVVHGTGYAKEMIGQLSFASVNVPAASMVLSAASMVVAVASGEPPKRAGRLQLVAVGLVVVASAALIFLVEYLSWSNVGASVVRGVNGRYFVPLFVLALSAVAVLVPWRTLASTPKRETGAAALMGVMVVVSLVMSCARFEHALWP